MFLISNCWLEWTQSLLNSGRSGTERLWHYQVYIGEIGVEKVRNELLQINSISDVGYDISIPWDSVTNVWGGELVEFRVRLLSLRLIVGWSRQSSWIIYLRNKSCQRYQNTSAESFYRGPHSPGCRNATHIHINTLHSDDEPEIPSYKIRRNVARTKIKGRFWSSLLLANPDLDGMWRQLKQGRPDI